MCSHCGNVLTALKHLNGLDAFNKPNPTLDKAIVMRRLLDAGVDVTDAYNATKRAYNDGRTMKR